MAGRPRQGTGRGRVLLVGLIVGPLLALLALPAATAGIAHLNGMRSCRLTLVASDDAPAALRQAADTVAATLGRSGVADGGRRAVTVRAGDPTRSFPPQPDTAARALPLTMDIVVADGMAARPPYPRALEAVLLHEVGHLAGLAHADGGVMGQPLSLADVDAHYLQVATAMGCDSAVAGLGGPATAVGGVR